MPRFKLILNPQSDHGHTGRIAETLKTQVESFARSSSSDQPIYLDWVQTEYPGHATVLVREIAGQGYDVVVAIGGDGTAHEVINGLMNIESEHRPVLGILPLGSGNDFAYNIGIPPKLDEALDCLFGSDVRSLDIGTVADDQGRMRYWDNTIGIGFSGAVNIAAKRITWVRGFLLYLLAVLETILFKPPALTARFRRGDGDEEVRQLSMVSLCNGPREGGGFPVAPGALMDDGLITYVLMRQQDRLGMLYFLPIVMGAKHLSYSRVFEAGTASRFAIQTDQVMAVHVDGETFGPWEANIHRLEVTMIPGALRVLTCGGIGLSQ